MGWAAIISAILGVVGPLIGDLLKKWLDRLLNRAAASLDADGVTLAAHDNESASRAVLERAIDMTPRVRIFRRAMLRHMLAEVPPVVGAGGTKLPKAAAAELAAVAAKDA